MIDLNKVDKMELFNHYCNTLEREVDLKHRIDKAIEYIESKIQHRSYKVNDIIRKYDYLEMFDETIVELLDILKGDDKDDEN